MANRLWVLVLSAIVLTACTRADGSSDTSTVLVFAAASLSDVFTDMATTFEADNPTADVQLSFAGSSALREQILDGAPADIFASANPATIETVVDAGLASGPVIFARNELAIAVDVGNPENVSGLESFTRVDLLLGTCAPSVPCGELARQVFANADVDPRVDTEEPDVRALLAKIGAGELDAGIVYATDIAAKNDVEGVLIPDAVNVQNAYAIALVENGDARSSAEAFIAFVRSDSGLEILTAHGFATP